ncbi:MAG: galactokinase, partial [Treponema sp.]|nr:galactokinase [Treponema sp.]
MSDIGLIHRTEYEIEDDRSGRGGAPGRGGSSVSGPYGSGHKTESRSETVVIAEAPGRIHFLGEHSEQKAGLFISSEIDRYARVAVSIRKDNSLRFYAADLGERKRTTLLNLKYKREDRWANYIKVAIHVFAELGYPVKGLNFTISGDIPQQVGLASSSAIEAATALALKGFFKANIAERDLIYCLTASKAQFFGTDNSLVDYLIIFSAKKDQFLVIDESGLKVKRIKSPLGKYKLIVMDSRVPRMGVDEELKQRHADIKKGLDLLSNRKQGTSFRDFAATDLGESMGNLPEEIRRRSLHVVQEIRRVNDADESLK